MSLEPRHAALVVLLHATSQLVDAIDGCELVDPRVAVGAAGVKAVLAWARAVEQCGGDIECVQLEMSKQLFAMGYPVVELT